VALTVVAFVVLAGQAFLKTKSPSPEVLQAIRLLLSDDAREEARGEHALKRMGKAIVPELRYWVRKAHNEADRVEIVLSDIEGQESSTLGAEKISASEFFHRKVIECRDLARDGRSREALQLAEAIVLLDKDGPYAWELRRLARRSRERLVAKEVLEPLLDVEKTVYEAGERPEILFRLINHEPRPARIRLDKGILGSMDAAVTAQFIDGNSRRQEMKVRIRVPENVEQILIGPGRVWEQPVELDLGEIPGDAVARIQVEGRFRPTRWTVEAEGQNITLSMPRTEYWVVPRGQADGCDRPVEKLTQALFFAKLEPFFVGGQLAVWAGEEDRYLNEKLVHTLVSSLDDLDPPRLALAGLFLNQATGQRLPADGGRWKEWWAKASPGAAPPAAGEGAPPREGKKKDSARAE
jgi:hypothetical protein